MTQTGAAMLSTQPKSASWRRPTTRRGRTHSPGPRTSSGSGSIGPLAGLASDTRANSRCRCRTTERGRYASILPAHRRFLPDQIGRSTLKSSIGLGAHEEAGEAIWIHSVGRRQKALYVRIAATLSAPDPPRVRLPLRLIWTACARSVAGASRCTRQRSTARDSRRQRPQQTTRREPAEHLPESGSRRSTSLPDALVTQPAAAGGAIM
jgi:hypothetical protein